MGTLTKIIVISDFDGTVVIIDTAAFVLERFAEGEWKIFDEQLEKGEITLDECLRKQFSLVRASKTDILREVERATTFRPNFDNLVKYCKGQRIPVIIASAGLDFCIRHLLAEKNLDESIVLRAGKSRCTNRGIKFSSFPKLRRRDSHNFKDDLVDYYKRRAVRVVYIGDTLNDYFALRKADQRFAIEGSRLAHVCNQNHVPCEEVSDFQQVIEGIKTYIKRIAIRLPSVTAQDKS